MPPFIRLEIADGVARITLDRPDALNAFAFDMREQLVAALDRVTASADTRVLVITGAGRGFCAGGDVRHMADLAARNAGADELQPLLDLGRAIVTRIVALPFPTLAAVNGPAAGAGLNLALACDLRWASDAATFGETFVRIGLQPDWGGTWSLPRLVGMAKAMELCWTGDMIDAAEALRIGLVERVIAAASFETEVATFAARLAAAPTASVRASKRGLRAALSRDLGACIDAENEGQAICWASRDVVEGMRAFVEKRPARFGAATLATATASAATSATATAPASAAARFE